MPDPIYIDDRDGSIDLVHHEPLLSTAEITRLHSGDAMFVGNGPAGPLVVGIEVKSIYDLMSSVATGRLHGVGSDAVGGQLGLLVETYDVRWLLVYGMYGPGPGGVLQVYNGERRGRALRAGGRRTVPYSYIESFLCEVATMGISIKNVRTENEAAQWLGILHRWWSKPWESHKGMRTFDKSQWLTPPPGVDANICFRACVASQLPGLGYERAMAAAAYFGSVIEMVNASAHDWAQVAGVGRVIAGAIAEAVRRR